MAGIGYKLRVIDLGMKRKTAELTRNFQQVEWPLVACGQVCLRSIEQNFRVGGRPDRWVPLAEATVKQKQKSDKTKILIDSADLKNSITAEVQGNTLTVGTIKVYGRIHQEGGKAGRGRKAAIPARPFVVVQEQDKRIFKRIFREHLNG